MFRFTCPQRWSDLDAQRHVNNATVVDYLQEARVAFLKSDPNSTMLDSGVVVVAHQVEYRRAIEYQAAPVVIELWVSKLGASRFELAYRLSQGDHEVAVARTVLCPFDFAANRPCRVPAADREFLAAHVADSDPLGELPVEPTGRSHATDIYVRWSDLDRYGHVNNAVTFDYVQQARIEATTAWDPAAARFGTDDADFMWLLVRQDVKYVAQQRHQLQPYRLETAVSKVGRTSLQLVSTLIDPSNQEVIVTGASVLVCATPEGKSTPLPDTLRSALRS